MYKKSRLSSAIFAITASMAAASAQHTLAQEAAEVDEILIQGIRGSLLRSEDIKRQSSGVVDAISSEDIGKFPDQNLAESLQRITGVSIDRAGGEGQLITVRGFGPDFNTVLINGRQIASESNTRAFDFDTISADMVNSISVYKTATATKQSGGIGATVNITTARPMDFDGLKIAGSVKGLNDDNSGKTTPEYSALISNTFDDGRFGALLAVSYKNAKTRLNQAQTDGWLENVDIPLAQLNGGAGVSGNLFSPRNYDTKVTFEDRKRTNGNLVLQFKPQDNFKLTADAIYSDFDIKTDATSYGHWFTAPNLENVRTDANGTVIDLYQEVGLATDFHSKKFDRLTNTKSYGLNGDWDVSDKLNLKFDAFTSKAEREANNGGGDQLSLIGYKNRVRFQSDDKTLPWVSEFEAPATGLVFEYDANGNPITHSVSDYLDPSNGRAHVMLRRGWAVEDKVDQYKVDGLWKEGSNSGLVAAKFGLMFSKEDKALTHWTNEVDGVHCTFCGYPDTPDIPDNFLTVFNAGSDFLSKVSGHGRTPAVWLRHNGEQEFSYLEGISGISFDARKKGDSYVVEEKTTSAYLEFDFAGSIADMPLKATAGARVESSDITVDGTEAPIEALSILDKTEMVASYSGAKPISADSSNKALLPNMSMDLNITNDVVARFAASRSLSRPPLNDISPATVIGTTRQGGNLTATSGEASLKPYLSDNVDLSLEWYYNDASYVSAGFFWKNVTNFIVNVTSSQTFVTSNGTLLKDPSTGSDVNAPDANDSVAVFTKTSPKNGEDAIVDGFELALQHTFGESGFGVIVNGTLVHSDSPLKPADITQKFAVTGISDSANVVGFYEKGPYQLRIAYNWRDEFLQSLTQANGDGVTYVDAYGQWDASGSYAINNNVSVVFEATNLTSEVVTKHGRFKNQFLLAEDAGRRVALGVTAKF